MKLLMHICCANCATWPLSVVKERGIAVKGFWFNPNIHPYTEYGKRLEALRRLQQLWDLDIEYNDCYGLTEYLRNVVGNEGRRCEYCYTVRLEQAAMKALEIKADAFSTTLLVSPYQKFDMIIDVGRLMQERYAVEFYAEDFRKGFREGRQLAGTMGLYRQQYCGCIYSEMERYEKKRYSVDPHPTFGHPLPKGEGWGGRPSPDLRHPLPEGEGGGEGITL